MCKVGEVYSYNLKNDIGTVLKAGLGLFVVIDVKDSFTIVCPAVPFNIIDTSKKGVEVVVKNKSKEEKLFFLSDLSIALDSRDLKELVAELSPAIYYVLAERCKHNKVLTNELREKNNEADIIIHDEETFLNTLDTIKDQNAIVGRRRYLETDKSIILKTEEVILDDPYSTLTIPINIEDDNLGFFKVVFESKKDEEANIIVKSEGNSFVLCLKNFDDSLGRFTTMPIGIGKINDKELGINIWSSLSGKKTTRIVKYTMYLEK